MRSLRFLSLTCVILTAPAAWCADASLSPLAEALTEVRSTHGANDLRDAGPELTPVKQQLRAWVEGYLPGPPVPFGLYQVILPGPRDFQELGEHLNKILDDAGLTCRGANLAADRCMDDSPGFYDARGYLGEVRLSSLDDGRYILVVTAVGIRCGFDESAYIYERGPDQKWKMLLESEQDAYGVAEYAPQNFLSISASPSNVTWNEPAPPPLVLTLGYSPWCASNWQSLSTRLWRASTSTATPHPLIDRKDTLYIADDEIASARLTQKDVLIEFRGQSIDGGVLIRTHIEHYVVGSGDKLERIAPVALSPNDFIEEWLESDWRQAARWTEPQAKASVSETAHKSIGANLGEFDGPATRCRADPTLWQVSFATDDMTTDRPRLPSHFLVRWMAPYRFTLAGVQRRPFPRCDQVVAMPDDIGTLFPRQGWSP